MASERRHFGSPRQWALLAGLAVVLAGVLWYRGGGAPTTPANAGRAASNRQGQSAGPDEPLNVRLESLDAERAEPVDIERNPFRFEERRRSAPQPDIEPRPPQPEVTPPPAGPPPPPPISLKFIGIIESPGAGKMAALSDGRHVFHGREGAIIEGRYRIVRIGVESIVLERLDGGTQQTIRLSGQ